MPEQTQLSITVTVNQENGTYNWSYDPPTNTSNVIETLEPGNYEITFTLSGNSGGTWAANWIQWTNLSYAGSPPGITVNPPSGTQAVLTVDNNVQSQAEYDFRLVIDTPDGLTTSPDPDIVLEPPGN